MKVITVSLLISFFAITTHSFEMAYGQNSCVHTENVFRCIEFVKNYDGDTVTVNIPNLHPLFANEMHVRISGIDTAEIRTSNECEKEMAIKAKEEVKKVLTGAKYIELSGARRGKYFRIVSDVIFDGRSLAEHLVNKKLAVLYDGRQEESIDWCKYL